MNALSELARQVWDSFGVVAGFLHPAIETPYQPGWTTELQDQEPAEAFDAKPPRKRRRK